MRTFLSAVSLCIACWGFASDAQLTAEELTHWKSVEPSVVMVLQNNNYPRGVAALIDADGWFLAHRSVVANSYRSVVVNTYVRARLPNGRMVQLRVVAEDDGTQLVLMQASHWSPDMGRPVKLVKAPLNQGDLLFAVIPSGVIRAQFSSGNLIGVNGPSRRLVPLAEIRFEAPADKVGGGLVFTVGGELVGVMQATLGSLELRFQNPLNTINRIGDTQGAMGRGGGGGGFGGAMGGGSEQNGQKTLAVPDGGGVSQARQSGPQSLTVAFCVGQGTLNRVVRAFLSPQHLVTNPTLGVFCREASSAGTGALIEGVQPSSAADRAGLRINDVIIELAGKPIHNQVDFAEVMADQDVGKTIQVKVRRDGATVVLNVVVGSGVTKLVPSP